MQRQERRSGGEEQLVRASSSTAPCAMSPSSRRRWSACVRALAHVPIPTEKRQQGQRDIAVQVQGVWIRPGDRLYADGIVVLARAPAERLSPPWLRGCAAHEPHCTWLLWLSH